MLRLTSLALLTMLGIVSSQDSWNPWWFQLRTTDLYRERTTPSYNYDSSSPSYESSPSYDSSSSSYESSSSSYNFETSSSPSFNDPSSSPSYNPGSSSSPPPCTPDFSTTSGSNPTSNSDSTCSAATLTKVADPSIFEQAANITFGPTVVLAQCYLPFEDCNKVITFYPDNSTLSFALGSYPVYFDCNNGNITYQGVPVVGIFCSVAC
ncbi:unnamed protein product [Caenorhabditis auriculariae]|uniref:Uncharacterized protein n=1 Tax=Caenorhabditis auriculariae TaxID=2777116 RepID=A0A8S1HU12_9PELO|nr:unnamed protein product [Caenorhabditis auriculariae]